MGMTRDEVVGKVEQLFPEGTRGRHLLRFAQLSKRDARTFATLVQQHWAAWGSSKPGHSYLWWSLSNRPSAAVRRAQGRLSSRAAEPIDFHAVVLASDAADREAIRTTLASLEAQTWAHWRATVVGAPDHPELASDRIAFLPRPATLEAAVADLVDRLPGRDLVLFLEAGDRLNPACLFEVGEIAWRNPAIDLIYWDDDLNRAGGLSGDPLFRPSWSPETLVGANYIGRSFAMRLRRLAAAGPPRSELGDARWWDLLLRSNLTGAVVERLPGVRAHLKRRPAPDRLVGLRIIQEHFERVGEPAAVTMAADGPRIGWNLERWPSVTAIIPTRHNRPLIERCLVSLERAEYPSLEVIVVDSGGRSSENEAWYRDTFPDLNLSVIWWDQPFNYSAVNNHAFNAAEGEVLVFLNDDTEVLDPSALRELIGWASRPEIGVVGCQLVDADGRIQHGGVILGLNGYADHLFQGMEPGSETMFGSTSWYRNVLAVTAACLAVRRDIFEQVGGFDERFVLCGSDVALGLDVTLAGKRNMCLPSNGVRHLEGATRGADVPAEDFFTSYWRYQRWLFGGDPYFSPNLSLLSGRPALRSRSEVPIRVLTSRPLGRTIGVFRQGNEAFEALALAGVFRADDADVSRIKEAHEQAQGALPPKSVTWFLPDVDSPFYGGMNTAFRIADYLAREHGVDNRFAFWADPNDGFFRSAITAAFPALRDSQISCLQELGPEFLARVAPTDVAIATLWVTAYAVAKFPSARRRFYLIQDFEPCFYPAGTLYGLTEETYRFGLYGICNSQHMLDLYRDRYGGLGSAFVPAVDPKIFHAQGRPERSDDDPVTIFVYARPGHFRNCWEVAALALEELKAKLGDRVRIVTAGSWARADTLGSGIEHLGLLDYRETGDLYRRCDIGVALTVSEHPSYLPLELMACGVPVVAYDNPAGYWILRHEENSILVRRTVDGVLEGVERLVLDSGLRSKLSAGALQSIQDQHSDWDEALSGIYSFLSDPEAARPGG